MAIISISGRSEFRRGKDKKPRKRRLLMGAGLAAAGLGAAGLGAMALKRHWNSPTGNQGRPLISPGRSDKPNTPSFEMNSVASNRLANEIRRRQGGMRLPSARGTKGPNSSYRRPKK